MIASRRHSLSPRWARKQSRHDKALPIETEEVTFPIVSYFHPLDAVSTSDGGNAYWILNFPVTAFKGRVREGSSYPPLVAYFPVILVASFPVTEITFVVDADHLSLNYLSN